MNLRGKFTTDETGRVWFTDPFNASAGDQELDHMCRTISPSGAADDGLAIFRDLGKQLLAKSLEPLIQAT
jgi:protocatechuate 3,4-dioxygenase beta subunit